MQKYSEKRSRFCNWHRRSNWSKSKQYKNSQNGRCHRALEETVDKNQLYTSSWLQNQWDAHVSTPNSLNMSLVITIEDHQMHLEAIYIENSTRMAHSSNKVTIQTVQNILERTSFFKKGHINNFVISMFVCSRSSVRNWKDQSFLGKDVFRWL